MSTTGESLNTPPSTQLRSSPFQIAILSPALGVLLTIGSYWLINKLLPGADGAELKTMVATTLLGGAAAGTVGGVVGMISRSLKITDGKIKNLTTADPPTTVNAGGDVNMDAGARLPTLDEHIAERWPDLDAAGLQRAAVIEQEQEGQNGDI